jgi:hypothetical protein
MTVEALMDLRKRVDETLLKRRAEIEQQLAKLGQVEAQDLFGLLLRSRVERRSMIF